MKTSRRRFVAGALGMTGAFLAKPTAASSIGPTAEAVGQRSTSVPTPEEIAAFHRSRRNWGRWGADDQAGAVNLITPAKRVSAAALVRSGRTVSLSRRFEPEQHFMRLSKTEGGGGATDYYGFLYHGQTVTHIDALSHLWTDDGMWNGRKPEREGDTQGVKFADITAWHTGLTTRGVLLDIPRHRGVPHVTLDRPVHASELEAAARSQNVEVRPGDALLVYSGREEFVRRGAEYRGAPRPGLHSSCAFFIRERDAAILAWDMMDALPDAAMPWRVHSVLSSFGIALLDNALLEPLASVCAEENRYEFMFMALPLNIARGTGSPVNPVAMF